MGSFLLYFLNKICDGGSSLVRFLNRPTCHTLFPLTALGHRAVGRSIQEVMSWWATGVQGQHDFLCSWAGSGRSSSTFVGLMGSSNLKIANTNDYIWNSNKTQMFIQREVTESTFCCGSLDRKWHFKHILSSFIKAEQMMRGSCPLLIFGTITLIVLSSLFQHPLLTFARFWPSELHCGP